MVNKISILSLFKNSFDSYLNQSIIKKAIQNQKIEIEIIDFRNFSDDKKHFSVDDTPYGGGPGMVIKLQPIVDCLKQIKSKDSVVLLTTPSGYLYNQKLANNFKNNYKHIIIICGHYEGIDERIYNYIDYPISIGDYILTGGELAALVIVDSITRLIDNVINHQSLVSESFNDNLLDYSVYTKPQIFENYAVPDVLISGNHKLINEFRKNDQILKTKKYRPDIYEKYLKQKEDKNGNF